MDKKAQAEQIKGQLLTKEQLMEKAADYKGIMINFKNNSLLVSEPFGTYELVGAFLAAMKEWRFTLTHRQDGVTTLSDDLEKDSYWNFKDKLLLNLCASFSVNEHNRGVVLLPCASGTFLSSIRHSSNFRIFRVVAKYDAKAHPLVGEMVAENGEVIVSWTQLKLGGIRSIPMLFEEFLYINGTGRQGIERLASSSVSPLEPNPVARGQEEYFLTEPYQPLLFKLWMTQLYDFKNSLP